MAVHVHQHITNSSTPSPTPSSIRLPSEEEQEILGEFKEQISACGFNLTNPASNYKIYYNSDPIEVQKLADNIPAFRNKALALFTEFKTAPAREEVLQILLLLLKHDPRQKNSSELLVGFIKEVVTSMKSSENESTERCITLCRVYTAAIDCLLQNINDENYRALRHQTQKDFRSESLDVLERLEEAVKKRNPQPEIQYRIAYAKESVKRIPTDAWIRSEILKHALDIIGVITGLAKIGYAAASHGTQSSSSTNPVQLIKDAFAPIFSKISLLKDWYDSTFLLKKMTFLAMNTNQIQALYQMQEMIDCVRKQTSFSPTARGKIPDVDWYYFHAAIDELKEIALYHPNPAIRWQAVFGDNLIGRTGLYQLLHCNDYKSGDSWKIRWSASEALLQIWKKHPMIMERIPALIKERIDVELETDKKDKVRSHMEKILNEMTQPKGPILPISHTHASDILPVKTERIGLPMKRNNNFTGRGDELRKIEETLSTSSDPIALVAETGQGGIGKTHLALEYTYTSNYRTTLWVQANTPETIIASYKEFAEKMGIEIPEATTGEKGDVLLVKTVLEWFEKNEDWLIVFDNAENAAEISPYLPKVIHSGEKGRRHVLITSRFTDWADQAKVIPVSLFTKEQSLDLLRKILKEEGRTFEQEKEAAEELVTFLGNLPLAISHAAYFIRYRQISISRYLEQLKSIPGLVLNSNADSSTARYERTVMATCMTSIKYICEIEQEVEDAIPLVQQIANICSFFNQNDIPREVLEKWFCKLNKGPEIPFFFDNALRLLRSYSLIHLEQGKISIHPLVQTVIRGMIPKEERREFFLQAADCLLESWKGSSIMDTFSRRINPFMNNQNTALIPHLERIYQLSQNPAFGEESEQMVAILCRLATHAEADDYRHYGGLLEKSLALSEKVPVSFLLKAEIYYERSIIFTTRNDYSEMATREKEGLNQAAYKALGILEPHLQDDNACHLAMLIYVHLILCACLDREYEQGKDLCLKLQAICEAKWGRKSKEFVFSLQNTAGLYATTGKFFEAIPLFLQVLELERGLFSSKDIEILANLALVDMYKKTNNFSGAIEQGEKTLALLREVEGLEAKQIDLLTELADLQEKRMNSLAAIEYLQKSLELQAGEGKVDLLRKIAKLQEKREQFDAAIVYQLEALELQKKIEDSDREQFSILDTLAELYEKTNNPSETQKYRVEAHKKMDEILIKSGHIGFVTENDSESRTYIDPSQFMPRRKRNQQRSDVDSEF